MAANLRRLLAGGLRVVVPVLMALLLPVTAGAQMVINGSVVRTLKQGATSPDQRAPGADVMTSTPEAFRAYLKARIAVFAEAIKVSGATVEQARKKSKGPKQFPYLGT